MPTDIGDQKRNDCAAWAVGYYYKSFQEKREHGWAYNSKHLFSPAYVYNQRSNQSDDRMSVVEAINIVIDQGISPTSYMAPHDTHQPSPEARAAAASYKATAQHVTLPLTASSLDTLKWQLANGDVFVMSIPIYTDGAPFFPWTNSRDHVPTILDDVSGPGWVKSTTLHAITVVGYDDALQRFRYINSWGNSWGYGGYGYVTYNFVLNAAAQGDTLAFFRCG
jgi:hypothetical protein